MEILGAIFIFLIIAALMVFINYLLDENKNLKNKLLEFDNKINRLHNSTETCFIKVYQQLEKFDGDGK